MTSSGLQRAIWLVADGAENVIRLAQDAEAAGFDGAWAPEDVGSAIVPVTVAGSHTRRIQLATGILHAFPRSPLDTALIAIDVNRSIGGRFVLGLGPGHVSQERAYGMPFDHPAARMGEYVMLVRRLSQAICEGQPFSHQGRFYNVEYQPRNARPAGLEAPRVQMGVLGPIMARTAGEVADGMLGNVLCSPWWIREVVEPELTKGLQRAGRDRASFDLTATLTCAISNDRAQARHDVARVMAVYARQPSNHPTFERHGLGTLIKQMAAAPPDQAAAMVSDEMLSFFCAYGPPDEVRAALKRYEGVADGVRILPPPFVLSPEELAVSQRAIVETFGR